ncbi:MAG: hypothetical protein EH225_06740 [Calditrichaeota bacterium]|nr:hypothetical protein [Calditrichota bacterium]RQW03864.1 MAG: hypothetical protein EH225_06740 [Calditrichota bacterium]
MAKKQDFASKVAKAQKTGLSCAVCGDVYSFVKKERAYFSEESQSWKYEVRNVKVCKCNENEVYA